MGSNNSKRNPGNYVKDYLDTCGGVLVVLECVFFCRTGLIDTPTPPPQHTHTHTLSLLLLLAFHRQRGIALASTCNEITI